MPNAQCSGERAGLRLPPAPSLMAMEGCAEAGRALDVHLPSGGIWGSPSLHSHPHSFASGWARASCGDIGISLWYPGPRPDLLNHVGFARPGLLAGRRVRSARLGRETRKASPDSVEDPSWASLIFERRKEAERRRAHYWRKHWGSQEMQREAGPVSVCPETHKHPPGPSQATCSVSGPCTQPEEAFTATAHLPAQCAWPFAGEDHPECHAHHRPRLALWTDRAPPQKGSTVEGDEWGKETNPQASGCMAQRGSRMVSIGPSTGPEPTEEGIILDEVLAGGFFVHLEAVSETTVVDDITR